MAGQKTDLSGLQSLAGIAVALLVAAVIGAAGGAGARVSGGLSTFMACGALAFAVQWLAFVPAYLRQTEHYFDLTGSITYIAVVLFCLAQTGLDARSLLLALLVGVWAVRLGSFLFTRVKAAGADRRFNTIKTNFLQFLMTWTLQGLWVFLTLAPTLAAMTSIARRPLGVFAVLGGTLWLLGMTMEVVSDRQKRRFREESANRERFISTGLWAWSQHPNYFGEILLWIGVALIALPVLEGWQHLTLISPLFVYVLLTRISGIRMLDARARRQWGEDADYQAYRIRTPKLVPRPPRTVG